jgi:photosystem II stability/assembly factor-like uncharacterized protein
MNDARGSDAYVQKHNPFVFFHSIIDRDAYCRSHVVSLAPLATDLQRISTTPNLSYIVPNNFNNTHEAFFEASRGDAWLRQYVPLILASPAFRQDGMLVITFDEAETTSGAPTDNARQVEADDDAACCGQIPGPNTPMAGILGPGGGRIGALILSPYVRPGTVSNTPYNHYSLLRTLEDIYGITDGGDDGHGHLGFAGSYGPEYPGPGVFGNDVFTLNRAAPPALDRFPNAPERAKADGTVEFQNPGPTGTDLRGVSCATERSCVAVGDRGTILTTTDGGATWQTPVVTGRALKGVSCATATDCVAVGEQGTVLTSADGGTTWSQRDSGTSRGLAAVSCATAATCTAVGDAGTVIATSDSGATWTSAPSGVSAGLTSVACPRAADGSWSGRCIAVGDAATMVITSDGWQTASHSQSTGIFRAISCASATQCQALGSPQNLATTDGGATWSPAGSINGVTALSCAAPSSCLVVGFRGPLFPVHGPDSVGIVNVSSVGGAAQGASIDPNRFLNPATRFDQLNAVSCPATTRCLAVGAHGTVLAVENLPTQSSDPAPTWSMVRSGIVRPLAGIACGAGQRCVAVGDGEPLAICAGSTCNGDPTRTSATLLSTSDGRTWSQLDPGVKTRLNSVACTTGTSCVAVGAAGTIVRTNDGTVWSQVADANGERAGTQLVGVSCRGATCVAVGGSGGVVYASQDSGQTWLRVTRATAEFLSAVDCASASSCIAVGGHGAVVRITVSDSDVTAEEVSSGTTELLTGVSCPSVSRCFAVGATNEVLTSGDGGSHWSEQQSPADLSDLYGVSCADARMCVAVGSDGVVIDTTDGGTIWKLHASGTNRQLNSVTCPSASECFVAGEQGTILRVVPLPQPQGGPGSDSGSIDSGSIDSGSDGGSASPLTSEPTTGGTQSTGSGGVLGDKKASPRCKVPRVVRKRLAIAKRSLRRANCRVGRVVRVHSRRRAGTVIRQSLRPSATRPAGTRVKLVVSRGR